jgi:hypothetical protein
MSAGTLSGPGESTHGVRRQDRGSITVRATARGIRAVVRATDRVSARNRVSAPVRGMEPEWVGHKVVAVLDVEVEEADPDAVGDPEGRPPDPRS